MTRVVSSGTKSASDLVAYDDTEWVFSSGAAFASFDNSSVTTPPPSNAAPVTPPPQASVPGAAIDNDQPSLTLTTFFPLTGIFPSQGGGGGAGSFLGEIGIFAGNFAPGGDPRAAG
jgi:microcystin-dependent protein